MKKKILIIIVTLPLLLEAQTINFPDANFFAKLMQSSTISSIARNLNYVSIKIDANNDGQIQVNEALQVGYLNVSQSNITNLTGIENFTNLVWFSFGWNNVTTADLTSLTQLDNLTTVFNPLSTLNITGLSNLKIFICISNQLTTLNFSSLPNLKTVYCDNNLLTSLDFTANPLFDDLGCQNNPNLTTIKIKNGRTQLFGSTTTYNECWGNNPNLSYICADDAEIPALQTFLAGCGITQTITIDSACALGTEDFELQNISVYPNPATNSFSINTGVEKVAVYNLTGQLVQEFKGGFESGYNYDIQGLSAGVYLVKIVDNNNNNEKSLRLIKK